MIEISKKLVFDYVQGNDIGEYEVEELESNPEFMMSVIRYTNDKNMYTFYPNLTKTEGFFIGRLRRLWIYY